MHFEVQNAAFVPNYTSSLEIWTARPSERPHIGKKASHEGTHKRRGKSSQSETHTRAYTGHLHMSSLVQTNIHLGVHKSGLTPWASILEALHPRGTSWSGLLPTKRWASRKGPKM